MSGWRDSFQQPRVATMAITGLAAATVTGIVAVKRRQALKHKAIDASRIAALPDSTEPPADEGGRQADAAAIRESTQATSLPEAATSAPQGGTEAPSEIEPRRLVADHQSQQLSVQHRTENIPPVPPPPPANSGKERVMGLRTLLSSLQGCERVCPDSIMGPFQMNQMTGGPEEEVPVVCFQFRMSHFTCKAYLAHGTQEEGSQHLKLQTTFEDNRRALGEEQRYFIANEWNATKRYTRLKCGSGVTGRSSVFTLEYDVLVPAETPHYWGLLLISNTLRMWYTSMVACVMHIVEPRDVPFATHVMITANTLSVTIREEDKGLLEQACPICFENFRVGEKVRRLPCMHLFHCFAGDADPSQGHHCNIDRHLVRDKQCPVCKMPVDFMERLDKNAPQAKVVEGEALQLPDGSAPAGANATSVGQEHVLSDAANQVMARGATAVTETPNGLGLVDSVDDAAVVTPLTAPSFTRTGATDGEVATVAAAGQSVASVARGATAQGVAAAAEVAAAAARISPLAQQEGAQGQGQAAGLPAQAAELERAVRSLQSRWMQIQDVVAGMQQMLQYIEESQSMMSAARAEQQQQATEATGPDAAEPGDTTGGALDPPANSEVVAASGEQPAPATVELEGNEVVASLQEWAEEVEDNGEAAQQAVAAADGQSASQAPPNEETAVEPTLPNTDASDAAQATRSNEDHRALAGEERARLLTIRQQLRQVRDAVRMPGIGEVSMMSRRMQAADTRSNEVPAAPAPATVEAVTAEQTAYRSRLPNAALPQQQGGADEISAAWELARVAAADEGTEEANTRRSSRVAETSAEPVQASVTGGLLRWLPRNSAGAVQPAPGGKRLQQPFTEAEKVCMAWAWRYRRANMMGIAPDAAAQQNSGNESSAQS